MKSFIAATLMLASLGFAAPPVSTPPRIYLPPPPDPARAANKLPSEAAEALKSGVKFTLFSLNPGWMTKDQMKAMKPEQIHHDFIILGSTELVNAETRNSAITSLTDAVKNSDGSSALCFSPRHSLRVITSNGTIYDFVTCFECSQIVVYCGENRIGGAKIKGTQKPLDEILTAAKIPLAKPLEGKK